MSFEKSPCFVLDLSESDLKGGERHFYEFKSFRLNVAERQLLHRDSPIPLTPKAFDVLAALVERSGHLVSRDELLETVWTDSFVEEQNITRVIHTLRRALGENENGDKFIETVARKGYRFVADVTEVRESREPKQEKANGEAAPSDIERPDSSSPLPQNAVELIPSISLETLPAYAGQRRRTRVILFTVGFLTAVSLLVLLSFDLRSDSATRSATVMSIAVLPLRPVSEAQRDEVYEMGLAESLINTLGPMKGLIVRPLSATRQYSDIEQDPLAAGREQRVDYVLASNYQIADGRIRITSQLFNVATGQIHETYKSEKDAADLFAMQDAFADEVGNKLIALFGATATGARSKRGTTNEEAYRLYLQGKNLIMKRSAVDAKKASEYLEQAIRLDPNFASAYAQLALATPYSESGKVKELISRALELDPNLAEAYVARADRTYYEWDFESVDRDIAKAIELEPNNDTARWLSALMLTDRGRFDEALTELDIAQAINPGAVMYMFHRGRILYFARRYDEAIAQFRLAMDLDDRFMQPYGWTARVYEMRGDYATAYQFLLKREERGPRKDELESIQKAYEAEGIMGARRHLSETGAGLSDVARLHAIQGDKDRAFECLNRALEKRESMLTSMSVEPAFDNLRDDPRFDDLVRRVGFR